MSFIDAYLGKITMYRLVVYYLLGLLGIAAIFSTCGILTYSPVYMLASAAFLLSVSWLSNTVFALIWNVPTNSESSTITALILTLIITPAAPNVSFWFLLWAALLATASKYILNAGGKHIFNPAAIAVALTLITVHQSASWWVGGNLPMLPFVLLGGLLVVRKIHRFDLVLAFLITALTSVVLFSDTTTIGSTLWMTLVQTPLLFFAFVMITEPWTTPPRRWGRILYGALVGVLFSPHIHIMSVYSTPEIALIVGNWFSYLISPEFKAILALREINTIGTDTYEFVFDGSVPYVAPGSYAEWTVPAKTSDGRGNRRWFTIASSPTERNVRLGVKFYAKPSLFKTILADYKPGDTILVGAVGGDFTLPRNKTDKLAFIAGGIGITPFRSMIKYMIDTNDTRDTVLLYANKTEGEICYRDLFDTAEHTLAHFKARYTLTGDSTRATWSGLNGQFTPDILSREIPDYKERIFYISGPRGMVVAYVSILRSMGVPRYHIKTDFFPGFA